MSDIKAKLKTYFTRLLNHPACWSNATLLTLTTGFEQAWETVVLKCPEREPSVSGVWSNQWYSVIFLVAPALALWILGMLGSNAAWRIFQGLWSRDKSNSCCCWISFGAVLARTVVVPLTWVFVALIDGDFYACYKYMPSCPESSTGLPIFPMDPVSTSFDLVEGVNCTKNASVWKYEKKSESQLISWVYLVVCLFLGLCFVCCSRCFSSKTYFKHIYSTKLTEGERKLIKERLMEQAEKDGKINVDTLMMKEKVSASEWASICKEYSKEYDSPLSEFLQKNTEPSKKPNDDIEAQV